MLRRTMAPRKLLIVAAVSAALMFVGSAPALAAGNDINPGDSFYSISCDQAQNQWQLFSVDASTAFSTKIGVGAGTQEGSGCALQPAYDVTTGKSYYIQEAIQNSTSLTKTSLAQIDVTTGVSTTLGSFVFDNGDGLTPLVLESIAIGLDGSIYAFSNRALYSITLTGLTPTTPGVATLIKSGLPPDVFAFAADPTSGVLYAIDLDNEVFSVDGATGEKTDLGVVPQDNETNRIRSLQIDGAGRFWLQVQILDGRDGASALRSWTLGSMDYPTDSGIFTDEQYNTEAILIIPGAVPASLPKTGSDAGSLAIAAGAGVAALTLGLLLVLRRRRVA